MPSMPAPRFRSVLPSSLCLILGGFLLLGSCTEARDDGKGKLAPGTVHANSAEEEGRHGQAPKPSAITLDAKAKGTVEPQPSRSGPSYLVVLASWKLGSEEAARPTLRSLELADGFPRSASKEESGALRSGYGALLAGICTETASAEKALASLRAEGFDAYLKETDLKLPASCPLPSRQWQLDHELLLVVESDRPDALALATSLLDQGASPHGIGDRSPLDLAAYQNDVSLARLLLERGARPNRPKRPPQQESTLELALRTPQGDPFEMVQLLIKHGADVNAETQGAEADPGSTVQLMAIRGCYPQILTYLQEKGAKPHPVSDNEVCRDRLPSQATKAELSAILASGSK